MWLLQQGVRTYFHAILCNKRLHFVIDLDNFDMLAFKLLKNYAYTCMHCQYRYCHLINIPYWYVSSLRVRTALLAKLAATQP